MKLTVIFADLWSAGEATRWSGEIVSPTKRTVQLNLTEEQAKLLLRKRVGTNLGKPMYEALVSVYFEPPEGG